MINFVFVFFVVLVTCGESLRMPNLSNKEPVLVTCSTTNSEEDAVIFELRPDWAPKGVERFVALVNDGFFDGSPFFRVVKDFLVQFGIAADPAKTKAWRLKGTIPDDSKATAPKGAFKKGYLSFAGGGVDSRGTELFIAYADSTSLGNSPWETPIGYVKYGMNIVDRLYAGYGDVPPFGSGPAQTELYEKGAEYVAAKFPNLDRIIKCSIMKMLGGGGGDGDGADDDDDDADEKSADDEREDDEEDDEEDEADDSKREDQQPRKTDAPGKSAFNSTTLLFVVVVVLGAVVYAAMQHYGGKRRNKKFDD